MVGDLIDHLRVHDYGVVYNQIRNEVGNPLTPKQNRKTSLLLPPVPPQSKRDAQSIFIRLFMKSMSDFPQNLQGRTHDRIDQLPMEQLPFFVSIRVHSWFHQNHRLKSPCNNPTTPAFPPRAQTRFPCIHQTVTSDRTCYTCSPRPRPPSAPSTSSISASPCPSTRPR